MGIESRSATMTRFGSLPVSGTLRAQTGEKSKSKRPTENRRIIETAVYLCYVGSGNAAGNNHLMKKSGVRSSEFGVRSSEFGVRSSEFGVQDANIRGGCNS
jgi:hypothetical protein